MENILDGVHSPDDIKKLEIGKLDQLASEIRQFLVEKVSNTGGHLASNLGVVELTLALHKVFKTPNDKIVWDVGHQTYIHKIITGRKEQFDTLRMMDGISGFPKRRESEHDCFDTGHSSTSISAALGMAKARDILKQDHSVIAVIGDGALTGGMAFEALNDAGHSPNNFIVILNDNQMSISKNVGGLSKYLSNIRSRPIYFKVKEDIDVMLHKIPAIGKSAVKALDIAKGTIKYMIMPGVIFEELGLKYLGPIDGHNISELINVLSRAKMFKGPVLIHVCTQKGKGYLPAENKPHKFHGISPFEIETGELKEIGGISYSTVFGDAMSEIGAKNERVVAITAAMPLGTGLDKFSKEFPTRFFDVGIAEQHAVTFAAGLAACDLSPVFAVYSSFLQRAYDQILHDVAIQNLHVVFAIDRAGVVGEDGETHQGVYDIAFLRHIPNITIMAPCDYNELRMMLLYAIEEHKGPIAIRYPRGTGKEKLIDTVPIELGRAVKLREGEHVSVVSMGNMLETALKVCDALEEQGITVDLIHARFAKPLDGRMILESAAKTKMIVTIEDNTIKGGFGSSVLEAISLKGIHVKTKLFGFPDQIIVHGTRAELYKKYKLDVDSISKEIVRIIKKAVVEI